MEQDTSFLYDEVPPQPEGNKYLDIVIPEEKSKPWIIVTITIAIILFIAFMAFLVSNISITKIYINNQYTIDYSKEQITKTETETKEEKKPLIKFLVCNDIKTPPENIPSSFDIYLEENTHLKEVYKTFSDAVDDEGNKIYPEEFIIGLLANIEAEGAPGIVEKAFSKYNAYGFALPSGCIKIQNQADIDYLLNWTTEDFVEENESVSKGSCGVGSIQWSFGRRIKWLKNLNNLISTGNPINNDTFLQADLLTFLEELKPTGSYYKKIQKAVGENGTVEKYAEAICDYYVKPSKCCGCMNGTGDACISRSFRATELLKMKNDTKERIMVNNDISKEYK